MTSWEAVKSSYAWSLRCLKWMGTCRCCHVELTKQMAKRSTTWPSSKSAGKLIQCGPLSAKKVEANCPLPKLDWPLLSFCNRLYIFGEAFFAESTLQLYLTCPHCEKMQQFFSGACNHFIIGVIFHFNASELLFLPWTCFCFADGNDDRLFVSGISLGQKKTAETMGKCWYFTLYHCLHHFLLHSSNVPASPVQCASEVSPFLMSGIPFITTYILYLL